MPGENGFAYWGGSEESNPNLPKVEFLDQLTKQIVCDCDELVPSPEHRGMQNNTVERLRRVLHGVRGDIEISIYGSFAYGFDTVRSDLDIGLNIEGRTT